MIAWRPAGIILSGADHSDASRAMLEDARIPVLELWDVTDKPIDLCVGIDHRAAGVEIARYLRGLGYRRPAYVGFDHAKDTRGAKRLEGFASVFAECGTEVSPVVIEPDAPSFEAGFRGTEVALGAEPDVIYYLNDHMAFGGIMACERRGFAVPEDVGIAGFNGLNINEVLHRRITTTVTPRRRLGEVAAANLLNRILGATVNPVTLLPVEIEVGGTTVRQPRRPRTHDGPAIVGAHCQEV